MTSCEACGDPAIQCATCHDTHHCGDLECMGRDCAAEEWAAIRNDELREARKEGRL